MQTEREHDLLEALKKMVAVTVQIPVDWKQPHAKEISALARGAVDHALTLLKRIAP